MTNVALMPQRPPYVEFETRAEEDRQATIEAGHYVAKDVDYAIIRAIGAKDAVEKPALEWLGHIEKMAATSRYNREWAKFFREQYNEWKAGHETAPNGFHVKNWPAISPAQRDMLVAARILTVEDLAAANEETLQRIGIGARGLKHRAQAWLDTVQNTKSSEELSMLREKAGNQDAQIAQLTETVQNLMAQLENLTKTEKRRKAS